VTFLRASDRAESTKLLYRGLTARHVEPVIGAIRLDQLRPTDITRVLLSMERAGKAASTRRNTYAALRGALDDAVANGLLGIKRGTTRLSPFVPQSVGIIPSAHLVGRSTPS
jgi:hypothetical protein